MVSASSDNARHQPHGKRPWKNMPTHHHIWPQKEPSLSTDKLQLQGRRRANGCWRGPVADASRLGTANFQTSRTLPAFDMPNNGAMTSDFFFSAEVAELSFEEFGDLPNLSDMGASVLHQWRALQGTGDQIAQQRAGISCRLVTKSGVSVLRTWPRMNVLFA